MTRESISLDHHQLLIWRQRDALFPRKGRGRKKQGVELFRNEQDPCTMKVISDDIPNDDECTHSCNRVSGILPGTMNL